MHAQFGCVLVASPSGLEKRVDRRLEVRLLGDATFDRADLFGAFDPVADLAGALGVPASVPERNRVGLACSRELLTSELRDRLQHAEPVGPAIDLHECLVEERLELVEAALAWLCAHGFDVRDRASAGEDRQPAEQALLLFREEGVAPADGGAQCLLPFGSVSPTRCEQVEGTVQPLE